MSKRTLKPGQLMLEFPGKGRGADEPYNSGIGALLPIPL